MSQRVSTFSALMVTSCHENTEKVNVHATALNVTLNRFVFERMMLVEAPWKSIILILIRLFYRAFSGNFVCFWKMQQQKSKIFHPYTFVSFFSP